MEKVTMQIQIDPQLLEQAEAALEGSGMTIDSAFSQFLEEWILERKTPPSPYLSTPESVADDLRRAEEERSQGYRGHTLEEVLAEMDRIIAEAGEAGA